MAFFGRRALLLAALIAFAGRAAFAEIEADAPGFSDKAMRGAILYFKSTVNTQAYLGMSSVWGSHRNGIGIEGDLLGYYDVSVAQRIIPGIFAATPESAGVSAKAGGIRYESDFGIPGEKFVGELHLAALYSLGAANSLFHTYPFMFGNREHSLRFGYTGYLSSDSTSQITGQLDYAFAKGRNAFLIDYENDTMLFYSADKYRTAAVRLSYLYDLGREVAGVSAGFALWAGERNIDLLEIWNGGDIRIPEEVHRGRTVSLYNGRQYSLDAVYVSLMYGMYSLSFGYDSELFKKAIHNSIHYLLNDGNLPLLDREDRFYVEFRIGFPDDLY